MAKLPTTAPLRQTPEPTVASFSIPRPTRILGAILCWLLTLIVSIHSSLLHAAGDPPAAPGNLTGAIDNGIASLSWEVPSDDDTVEGYNIYINDRYSHTVRTNNFSKAVEPDTLYSFKVVAFDEEPRRFSPASQTLALPASLVPDELTIPPSIPTGLTGNVTDTTATLSWEPSTDDEAVLGYNVYRDNRYLTTVRTTTYTGNNEPDSSHSWYIVAFDIRTNFSPRSERIVLPDLGPVDTTLPPSVPTSLSGNVSSGPQSDAVTVNWAASSDDQAVAGYNIYRNRRYIATRFATEYIGTVDAGSINQFSVVAFDFDGNFSTTSEALTLPVGSEEVNPGVAPSAPTGLIGETTAADGQTRVSLSWEPSTSSVRVLGYNIYRNNQYRTSVFTNAYSDTVTAGTAFSYRVVAFDDFGNFSTKSDPLNLLGDANQPPFFSDLDDQSLRVGEDWELVLRPVDVDGGAAGILISNPPDGVQFVDNRNGSRSLKWQPTLDDAGSYEITITAFDLQDTDLRTSQTIRLTVSNSDDSTPVDAPFSLSVAQAAYKLQEGDQSGVSIPITLMRDAGFEETLSLSVTISNPDDERGISTSFSREQLQGSEAQSELALQLDIAVLPIVSHQRRFTVTASEGNNTASVSVTVAVLPVARDDVYLLVGQSNAVGFSEEGAKQAGPGGLDEPVLRIRQANVLANDSALYPSAASYIDSALNFRPPGIVTAQDPLHEPVDPSSLSKEGTRIGMGLSFAKAALPQTSRNIILVPAAWAASGFCNTQAPGAHWNALPTDNAALGNTLLFERAVSRVNQVLQDTGGILRGILWSQGEADSNAECAPLYEENLLTLIAQLRSRVAVDARGGDARGPAANIPFVVGTMSRGSDNRGDFSIYLDAKEQVDSVHRNIANLTPFSEVVINDDLVPYNGYPCGEGSCVHFGSAALREMGTRSHEALLRASGQ